MASVEQIVEISKDVSDVTKTIEKETLEIIVNNANNFPASPPGWTTLNSSTPTDPEYIDFFDIFDVSWAAPSPTDEYFCLEPFKAGHVRITYQAPYPQNTTARYEIRVLGRKADDPTFYPHTSASFPFATSKQPRIAETVSPLNVAGQDEVGNVEAIVTLQDVEIGDSLSFEIKAQAADQPARYILIKVFATSSAWTGVNT